VNTKIIFTALCTLIALGALTYYSFGPGANTRVVAKPNPLSLQATPTQTTVGNKNVAFNTYHNKDLIENFFTIQFPKDWQTQASQAGGYTLSFTGGTASVQTIDVPDNSTLELFVLSQEEPKLKASNIGYARLDYKKTSVNGSDAYQLSYSSTKNGTTSQTTRTYIAGADKAGLIVFDVAANQASTYSDFFGTIVTSFHWEK
jgi:hypothetical protein